MCHYDSSSEPPAWHRNSAMAVGFESTLSQRTLPTGVIPSLSAFMLDSAAQPRLRASVSALMNGEAGLNAQWVACIVTCHETLQMALCKTLEFYIAVCHTRSTQVMTNNTWVNFNMSYAVEENRS